MPEKLIIFLQNDAQGENYFHPGPFIMFSLMMYPFSLVLGLVSCIYVYLWVCVLKAYALRFFRTSFIVFVYPHSQNIFSGSDPLFFFSFLGFNITAYFEGLMEDCA